MVRQCIFLLLILLTVATGVQSQPGFDSKGFLSIDCGYSETSSYVDSDNITYYSDDNFTDAGYNFKISSPYGSNFATEYQTVRSFPKGSRNCYTIRSLTNGTNYLIRATFHYANYDNLNKPPSFDIYIGTTFWYTVNASFNNFPEIIISATADFLDVCLVNKGQGIPFISSLHLRTFGTGMYPYVNSTKSLICVEKLDMGGSTDFLRYPDDEYDRWWRNYTNNGWNIIPFNHSLLPNPTFQIPHAVLKTAVTSSSTDEPLTLLWDSDDSSTMYYFILHFWEPNFTMGYKREFSIFINGRIDSNDGENIFGLSVLSNTFWRSGSTNYNVSLIATSRSTLPPLLNAFELYIVAPVGLTTNPDDVAAINSIKKYHKINKGWNGDPCYPTDFSWAGIHCSTDNSNTTTITSLDLSSSLLTGSLSDSFGNLTALQYLYLSDNDLSGRLPSSLDGLTSLKLLDIRGNPHLSTILPPGLEIRQQSKLLEYRYGDNSPKKNVMIVAIAVAIPLFVIAVVVAVVLVLKSEKYKRSIATREIKSNQPNPPNDHANIPQAEYPTRRSPHFKGAEKNFPKFENRKFSYSDLKKITTNFKNNIGTGGYGSVYLGYLENGLQVAVKMLSQTSNQGFKEFLAEAENLARVHHKNLISLMGYCTDKNCMALVYEYMQEGNLHEKLRDKEAPLSWKQRLQIAYESALGLEYLHKACNPPLIHRDVKTSNILLNANLEAKIADFGLSRAFDNDAITHVSTRIVGTVGYLDPEYYLSNQLSTKSDVFSFGVVLLEIITGRPPTGWGKEGGNLVQWVCRQLSGGDIESIVDPKMLDKYDINSVWKVVDLACKCTELASLKRPTMSAVVTELKETLDLQTSMEGMHTERTDHLLNDVSNDSTIGMGPPDDILLIGPTVR